MKWVGNELVLSSGKEDDQALPCGCTPRMFRAHHVTDQSFDLFHTVLMLLDGAHCQQINEESDNTYTIEFYNVLNAEHAMTKMSRVAGLEEVSLVPLAALETTVALELTLGISIMREVLYFELSKFGSIAKFTIEQAPHAGRVALCVYYDSRHASAAARSPLFAGGITLKTWLVRLEHSKVCPCPSTNKPSSSISSPIDLYTPTISETTFSTPLSLASPASGPWDRQIPGFSPEMLSYPRREGGLWAPTTHKPLTPTSAEVTANSLPGTLLESQPFVPSFSTEVNNGTIKRQVLGKPEIGRIDTALSKESYRPKWMPDHTVPNDDILAFLGIPSPPPPSGRSRIVSSFDLIKQAKARVLEPSPIENPNESPLSDESNEIDPKDTSQKVVRGTGVPLSNKVDLSRIAAGLETRTTVMLRNIPNKIDQKTLKQFIDVTSKNTYDFLYLRIDFNNKCNVGYAFISFTSPKHIAAFAKARCGKKWSQHNSEKIIDISFANIQGRDALIQKFRNSPVMAMDKAYRPKLYYTKGPNEGKEEPFPSVGNSPSERSFN